MFQGWRRADGQRCGVTINSSEAEFVDESQAGQHVVYLCALLRGLGYPQRGATEI